MKDKETTFLDRYQAAEEYISTLEEVSPEIEMLHYAIRRKEQRVNPESVVPIPPHPSAGRTNPTNASNLALKTGDETLIQLLQLNAVGDAYEFDYTPKTN